MLGQKIGHYEITAKLGQGGMGEVYRATDTKLNRDVALKFLPGHLQQDESARIRFTREAKSAAAMDHPYICSIFEVSRTDDGHDFITMEFVEGQTLQQKLEAGPVPLVQAFPILIEVAEALEKAHRAGFVHRDLKPSNIMLTLEGHAKVMDFGLAKRVLVEDGSGQDIASTLSREGSTLGTLTYMSPEQLRGESVDERSDIFSFGIILYEMLSGVHPFRRNRPMETAAAILKEDPPPIGRFLTEVTYLLSRVTEKLLAKDESRRYQLIHEVRTDLEDLRRGEGSSTDGLPVLETLPHPTPPLWKRVLPWFTAAAFALAFILSIWPSRETPPEPISPRRLNVQLSPDVKLVVDSSTGPAAVLSPDGSRLAFVGEPAEGGKQQIYLRHLDELVATPLEGTEGAHHPVFSPDGQWIAYRSQNQVKKISVNGGAVVTLCAVEQRTRGLDWDDDGSIVFATLLREGLSRVSSTGGSVNYLTKLGEEERSHRTPQVLPGGEWILFTALDSGNPGVSIVAQRLDGEEKKILWRGAGSGRYVASGHLLFLVERTLFAAAFDLETMELEGQPVPVLHGVSGSSSSDKGEFSVSQKGTLVYVPGTRPKEWKLEWLDRAGNRQPLRPEPANYKRLQFSPDGSQLALEIHDGRQTDIWVLEWKHGTISRLTFSEADDTNPVWSPGGRAIAFISSREGEPRLYWKWADGRGEAHRLTQVEYPLGYGFSWHPTGQYLAFIERTHETRTDIRILEFEGSDQSGWNSVGVTTFVKEPYSEIRPAFSPDGRWLAYDSRDLGDFEVYVRPFPGPGGRRQISIGGGTHAAWAPDGGGSLLSPERQDCSSAM